MKSQDKLQVRLFKKVPVCLYKLRFKDNDIQAGLYFQRKAKERSPKVLQ